MALEHSNSSLLIGRQHIRLNRVNSTNKYALDIISKSKPMEGTVISASYQYDGRGQIGRFWESQKGKNITCSTILRPDFLAASDQFMLNIAVSLALFDFIEHFLLDTSHQVKIKWPNDIYVDDEKIAGILIQNVLKGKTINTSVVGTGINVNQVQFSTSIPNPTSLAHLLGKELNLEQTLPWLFRFFTKRYQELKAGMFAQLKETYLLNLYRKDIFSEFRTDKNTPISGRIKGVDDGTGRLTVFSYPCK